MILLRSDIPVGCGCHLVDKLQKGNVAPSSTQRVTRRQARLREIARKTLNKSETRRPAGQGVWPAPRCREESLWGKLRELAHLH